MKTYKTYAEKLKDPRWQKKRLEIMERDEWLCGICMEPGKTLNVHHGYYDRTMEPWEYSSDTLWTLCSDCHKEVSKNMQNLYRILGSMHPEVISSVGDFSAEEKHLKARVEYCARDILGLVLKAKKEGLK